MKKKTIFIVFILMFFSFIKAWAQVCDIKSANSVFASANVLYKESKYLEAISKYDEILKSGFESFEMYYNLGNCFFKNGQLGKALLNYERARIFAPMDSDLRSNYYFVRSELSLDSRYTSKNIFLRFIDKFFDNWSVDFLVVVALIIWIMILSLLILKLFVPALDNILFGGLIVLVIFGILLGSGFIRKVLWLEKSAVVIVKEVEVKFEPIVSATTYFKISEGNTIEIIDKNIDWLKIRRSDGKIGWVINSSVEKVNK